MKGHPAEEVSLVLPGHVQTVDVGIPEGVSARALCGEDEAPPQLQAKLHVCHRRYESAGAREAVYPQPLGQNPRVEARPCDEARARAR